MSQHSLYNLFWFFDRCINRVSLVCLETTWFHYLYSRSVSSSYRWWWPTTQQPQWLDNPILQLMNRLFLFTIPFSWALVHTHSPTLSPPNPPTQRMEMDSNLCLWIGWDPSPLCYQWIEGLGSVYWYLFCGMASPPWAIYRGSHQVSFDNTIEN